MGELYHKIVLRTIPFHEMVETDPDPNYSVDDLRVDPVDRAVAQFTKYGNAPLRYTRQEWLDRRRRASHCELCGFKFTSMTQKQGDHDHVTGEWRGVVCVPCNLFLGYVDANPIRLDRVRSYLGR